MEQGSPNTGDVADLQQEDEYPTLPLSNVPVTVDGPVQTHSVPSVSGGSRTFTLVATDPAKRVANEDPRRRILRILSDQPFYVGESANEVQSRYAAKWPANVPLEITHQESVYVAAVPNGTTLTQMSATGLVVAGPVYVKSITLASTDGATSGAGKLEVRDGVGGPVLLTLKVLADTVVAWEANDDLGVLFTTGPHATLSGAGPGNFATFEYASPSNTVVATVSVLSENWAN